MILAVRQLQEKCQEMQTHLYTNFVDMTKAFDTVDRRGPFKVMQEFGCSERLARMVRQLNDGMMAHVTENEAISETFAATNRIKQGCVLAPTLFSLMLIALRRMMAQARCRAASHPSELQKLCASVML
nr:unnamed protein product [Spirometra erinaceieuropaei]